MTILIFIPVLVLIGVVLYMLSEKLTRVEESVSSFRALKKDIKFLIDRTKVIEDLLKERPLASEIHVPKGPVNEAPAPFAPPVVATEDKPIERVAESKPEVEEESLPLSPEIEALLRNFEEKRHTDSPIEEEIKSTEIPEKEEINRQHAKTFETKEPEFAASEAHIEGSFFAAEAAEPQKSKKLDLEKYIGENVINKIGIGILVIGIGFFVKYAIDKEWINETFRTLIGILCGTILIGLAHRMHKKFQAFSSVLVGGGLAVYYLSIAIAFHQYHLFSQTVAFGLMVCITGLAVWLSLLYDRKEIAVLAVIGGFGTPLFLSNGEGNYKILFSYLLILNIGMLVLASFKKWPLLNIVCYVLTVLLFGAWFMDYDFITHASAYTGALAFATGFYLVFFLMNIVYNLKETRQFSSFDYAILLSNSFLYFWVGMYILSESHNANMQGLFTAALSAFNFIFAFILFRNQKADKNFVYMLIGLVVAFVSLTGPVQLHGNYITMYWAAEGALLLWLSQKSGIKLLKVGSILITILMVISLASVWFDLYLFHNPSLSPIINKGFVTGVFCMVALQVSAMLVKREDTMMLPGIISANYRTGLLIAFTVLLYLVPLFEIKTQVENYVSNGYQQNMIISLYNYIFIAGLLYYSDMKKNESLTQFAALAAAVSVFLYFVLYRHYTQSILDQFYSENHLPFLKFYVIHLPVLILVSVIVYKARKIALSILEPHDQLKVLVYWFSSFIIVFMASSELYYFVNFVAYHPGASQDAVAENISKIGFPIVWGLCGFLFIRAGLVKKNRTLRIISLVLLLITVLKLFFFDISNASEIGKIIAFICLGVVLLIISFMYQKIRNLIFKDDAEEVGEKRV